MFYLYIYMYEYTYIYIYSYIYIYIHLYIIKYFFLYLFIYLGTVRAGQLMCLSDGGIQYLVAGARANVGVKAWPRACCAVRAVGAGAQGHRLYRLLLARWEAIRVGRRG